MSKSYLFILLSFISFSASAQIKKNSILVGGQLSYYNAKNESENSESKFESATISLSIGKAFKENSVIGISFGISPYKETNLPMGFDTVDVKYNRYDIGVFYREYKKLAKDFYFFGQVDGVFVMSSQHQEYKLSTNDWEMRLKGGMIALTPGIAYQVFKKMQVELTLPNLIALQYSHRKFEYENAPEQNSIEKQFVFYSSITNSTTLGYLGVGFRFLL